MGLKLWQAAKKMIAGIEVMHMIKKGQPKLKDQSIQKQNRCIHQLFGLTV